MRNYNVITMKVKLIRIGNSRGIRLPKAFIEEVGLDEDVELDVRDDCIVISRLKNPREGWEEAARLCVERGEAGLLHEMPLTRWQEEEWEWEW